MSRREKSMDGPDSRSGMPPIDPVGAAGGENRKVFGQRHGRGRAGGSLVIEVLVEMGRHQGRRVIVADGDLRNPTLANLYPPGTPGGALQPPSDELADKKEWTTDIAGMAMELDSSILIDFGGGDGTMRDYGKDLGLVEFAEEAGYQPLGLYICGPDMDDFDHILTIWRAGYFRPKRSLLIFNEHLVSQGRPPEGAFDAIIQRADLREMTDEGVQIINLPRLPCINHLREKGLRFHDAMDGVLGRDGRPLDPVRRFMVKQWLGKIEANIRGAGAGEWLP